MKNSEAISRVVNALRALNRDEHISKRYVLNVLRTKAKLLMLNNMHTHELLKNDNLVREIRCFALKPDDVVRCNVVEFRRCRSVMKSVKKLPEMLGGKYGSFVIGVESIDGEHTFSPTTLTRYRLQKDRLHAKYVTDGSFYVRDGYLYIPDSEVEAVNILLIGIGEEEIQGLSDCKEESGKVACKSAYEYEFVCPDKLIDLAIKGAIEEIVATWRAILPDENPNLNSADRQ